MYDVYDYMTNPIFRTTRRAATRFMKLPQGENYPPIEIHSTERYPFGAGELPPMHTEEELKEIQNPQYMKWLRTQEIKHKEGNNYA